MSDSGFKYCKVERREKVLTITLNRPEVLNAMNPEGHFELAEVFDLFACDPEMHVAILTGAGDKAFCVGTDLKELARTGDHRKPSSGFCGITTRFNLFKPVIAAVNGLCLGGGSEIVAACDLAIASDRAEFGLVEPRVGLAALGGGALQRLAREIPMKDAMMLVLTGKRITAHEAQRIRLINEVVPHEDLLPAAKRLAQEILACAPLAVQASKQVMLQSRDIAVMKASMEATYEAAEKMLASQDAVEGPLAFAEKRKPNWTGR
jgi:crotonobetainyl-CoA hydratase